MRTEIEIPSLSLFIVILIYNQLLDKFNMTDSKLYVRKYLNIEQERRCIVLYIIRQHYKY